MPSEKQGSYIELNRRFRRLEPKEKAEQIAFESYTTSLLWPMGSLSWDDLLKENRAVVLGEPGSGKSWEMRQCAKRLNAEGEFAFFVRLDQLVDQKLSELFEADEQKRFNRWKAGQSVAHFFLDSVDEAKFRRISDFHATLSRFRNELGYNLLLRTKLFLSSRISEWKPLSDGLEFQRLFPVPPAEKRTVEGQTEVESEKSELLVVQLEPLDRNQTQLFAEASRVSNVPAFLDAIDRGFAWEFARRPLDVADLLGFWKEKGRVGSLTELIEFDVWSKLRQREGRNEFPLSEAEGLEGAEWLAAASLFCRRFSFDVPDDGVIGGDALSPRACLPAHWRDEQIRGLVSRAIFDSAAYGQFRFHHRRVGEYLAAKWISARMKQGCPTYVLDQLLANVVRGRKVIRPSLRSIAAWLCIGNEQWNQFVRQLIIETDPGIHLHYGDPARLPSDYRRQILAALSRISKKRRRMWIESSPDCLARLADVDLSSDIAALILDGSLASDFRIQLLDIVKYGRLIACIDAAMDVVKSPEEPEVLKSHAASAICAMEDFKSKARLFETVRQLPSIPNRLCSTIIEALYPKSLSPDQLMEILGKTEPVQELSVDMPFYLKSHFEKVVTPANAGDLLRRLVALTQTPPLIIHGQRTLHVSDKFCWVGKLFPPVLEFLLSKPKLEAEEAALVAESLQLLGQIREYEHSDHHDVVDFNKSTIRHPAVRRNYLWRAVTQFRKDEAKEPSMSLDVFDHWSVLRLSPDDFPWLVHEIRTRTESADRLVVTRLAIETWDASGRTLRRRWHLRNAIRKDPVLLVTFQQSQVTSALFPIKRFWWRNIRYRFDKWWWVRKWSAVRRQYYRYKGQLVLRRNLRLLESGEQVGWLNKLVREADAKNHSHWAPSTWADLEKKRGKKIARAAKRGCMAAWRKFTPLLPHEKPKANHTSAEVVVGLTGLQLEFDEVAGAFENLSEGEARLAARYATEELNDFPKWFDKLSLFHPQAVSQVLSECIGAEWQFPAELQETHQILARLAWRGGAQLPLVREKIHSLLSVADPPNRAILRSAISATMRQPNPPLQHLAALAALRLTEKKDPGTISLWLATLMHIKGEAALDNLERILNTESNPIEIVVALCSSLSGEEMTPGPLSQNPSYLRPACLRRFIPIVYRHVRLSEDLNHGGEAYSPTARDHAQQFREGLLAGLENGDEPTATEVLRELADRPEMVRVRDWILHLLDKRLVRAADSEPWTPVDLREFAMHYETDPKTDGELFSIAKNRFQDVKWEVERSDNSAREELRAGDLEISLRRWLQRRLIERSQNRYTIPQEAEIDYQERPDLRLENPRTGPVSIEIKWAESWTLKELLERLENQLVGQYLRAHNSRYGIYFLGFILKQHYWKDPATGKQLTAADVIKIVSERAKVLLQTNPRVFGLEVISIDFRQNGSNQDQITVRHRL
jgi:hypothetical protein